jgi:hypothetical protein
MGAMMRQRALALAAGFGLLSISVIQAQGQTAGGHTIDSPAPSSAAPVELKGRFEVLPYEGGTPSDERMQQGRAGKTIPLWDGSAKVGRKTFHYTMVGQDPAVGNSPNVPVVIIPIKLVFKSFGNTTFDPTANDPTCSPAGKPVNLVLASPIFKAIKIRHLGTGQYTSLFQRGNYFDVNPTYKITLSPVTTLGVQTINVNGGQVFNVPCGKLGALDIGVWDGFLQNTLMANVKAKVTPTTFPIFLFYNVVLYDGTPSNCCILGYHSAFNNPNFGGTFQTYSTSGFDSSRAFDGTSDVSILSHEVAEWLADPDGLNPTPPWGHIGQVSGCQANLEVGDPLSGTTKVFTLNGFNYHLQDEAFTAWFYRLKPPGTYNNKFSLFGTFNVPAVACH